MMPSLIKSPNRRLACRLGWLGVDIGASAVKVAQIERREAGWRVHRASATYVSTGADPVETATEVLSMNLPRRPLGFERSAACVATLTMDLHNVELPTAAEDEAIEAMAQLPAFNKEKESCAVWRSSWIEKTGGRQPHHAMRMSHRLAERISRLLHDHRIDCRVIDCLPFALSRAVWLAGDASREPVAVVDCAAAKPLLTIVNRGQPFYTRQLRDCGFQGLIRAVGERLGLDANEVHCLLSEMERSVADGREQQQASQLIGDITGELRARFLSELVRTMQFLRSEDGRLSPTRIWLLGGGAAVPGLVEEVGVATGVPTNVWRIHSPDNRVTHATSEFHTFATALSLSAIPLLK